MAVSEIDPELSRLYREASSAGPPAALDAAILAAARNQAAKPRRAGRSSWVRWMAPASALATLAVAVSLAFLVEREQTGIIDETVIPKVAPRPRSPAPAPTTDSAKTKAADSAAPAAAEKKEAPAGAPPMLAPAAKLPAQAPAAFAAPALPTRAPAAVPRSAEPAPPAAQAFPSESRAKASESKMIAPKAATESNSAADSALGGAGAAAPAAPAAAGKLAPLRQQAIQRSPEAWLDEIARLKREGRHQEAAEQLAEFRNAYPAYVVPDALLK
jgi:hypothetical protein